MFLCALVSTCNENFVCGLLAGTPQSVSMYKSLHFKTDTGTVFVKQYTLFLNGFLNLRQMNFMVN